MWGFSSLAIVVYQKVASGFREKFVAQLHRQRWGYDTTKINQAQCDKVEDRNKKYALLQHLFAQAEFPAPFSWPGRPAPLPGGGGAPSHGQAPRESGTFFWGDAPVSN